MKASVLIAAKPSSPFLLLRRGGRVRSLVSLPRMEGDPASNQQPPKETIGFPVPLSPPPPLLSKNLELERALSASAKSSDSLLLISRNDFVYEDEWLVVVNKPSGVYCERVLSSVSRLLEAESSPEPGSKAGQPLELHLANRLDRDTSGVMVITKLHKAAAKLVKAYTEHKVKKTYVALCIGPAPNWDKITIRSGHGRSKFGAWRVYSVSDIGRSLPGGSLVKEMATSFEVLTLNGQRSSKSLAKLETNLKTDSECLESEMLVVKDKGSMRLRSDNEKDDEVLIRAYPESGRTHQIRLHCQWLGVPIRGDVKYGGVNEWKGREYVAHALHAESLTFEHPITGSQVEFHAPLPSWAAPVSSPNSSG
ncbi:RNA pseudouridine synthase 1 [Nymphaea thermarum]|nr:RNA pseudouridine synthase 1 [Nymphaea thermarum]